MDEIRVELMTFPMLRERATNYATRPFYKLVNVLYFYRTKNREKSLLHYYKLDLKNIFIADLQGLSILYLGQSALTNIRLRLHWIAPK